MIKCIYDINVRQNSNHSLTLTSSHLTGDPDCRWMAEPQLHTRPPVRGDPIAIQVTGAVSLPVPGSRCTGASQLRPRTMEAGQLDALQR